MTRLARTERVCSFRVDQEERFYAVEKFVKGEKDVLCATDVASKGLDFPDIQHVINYDLPEDIENYGKGNPRVLLAVHPASLQCIALVEQVVAVDEASQRHSSIKHAVRHRLRSLSSPTPVSSLDEAVLLDLKHLLIEAKQTVPPFLLQLESDKERLLDIGGKTSLARRSLRTFPSSDEPGCSYCNGLGHRITNCPKLESQHIKTANNIQKNDFIAKGNSDW